MDKVDENVEVNSNMKMILGEKLEEFVAKEFCNQTGKKVRNLNGILRNDKYPYAIANLDKPYSFTARIAFSTKTSVTAFWKEAAISA